MSVLLVKSPNRELQRLELSKNQPLSIGSHSISDIQLDDEGIALIEARISWAKKQFEITAAGGQGILVNGTPESSARLKPGDRFIIGSTQFLFTTENEEAQLGEDPFTDDHENPKSNVSGEIGLVPISDEMPAWEQQSRNPLAPLPSKPNSPQPPQKKSPQQKTPPPSKHGSDEKKKETPRPEAPASVYQELSTEAEPAESKVMLSRAGTESARPDSNKENDTAVGKLRESMHASRQRPGEREIFRSPLVLGLTLGGVFLLIGSVVLWSLINQEEADRYLTRAREQAEQRKFQQAISDYEQFLLNFPYDSENETAYRELSLTHVRSYLDIGLPDLSGGLQELEELIARHRDDEGFNELHGEISQYASQIAIEACEEAADKRDKSIFQLSESALRLVDLYTAETNRAEQIHEEVKTSRRKAEATILRLDVFDEAFSRMKTALKNGSAAEVMEARRDLIARYESAATDSRISKLLNEALQLEKNSATLSQETQEAAPPTDQKSDTLITLAATNRISKDELPSHRAIIVHAADCLYGVDSATGTPLWRHHIGWNPDFFPVEVTIGEPGILCHSSLKSELQFLSRDTGKMIWRQPVAGKVTGEPLIDGAEVFITTDQGDLIKLDVTSGLRMSQLTVTQPFSTSVELLADKKHLVAIGSQDVSYLINRNSLELKEVHYLGHSRGAISVAPLRLGPFLLLAENDRSESSLLRLFKIEADNARLSEVAQERIPGNILDPPVLRGNELFVPSTPERVTAFTVSEGVPPLVKVDSHQVVNPQVTSSWLTAGPDGQVWMASTALRRLKLLTESLEASTDITALGFASQPMQISGENLFVARRPASISAVRLSRYDRNTFSGTWQTTLGDSILHHVVNGSGELITLHNSGELFRLRESNLSQSGFQTNSNALIDFPPLLQSQPLSNQFSDGRFGVVWGGDDPQLITVRTTGQIENTHKLPASPNTIPIDLQAGVVVGLPGRLHLVSRSGSTCEDYVLPVVEGQQETWTGIVRVDENHLICLDSSNTLRRIEYRSEPIMHLALAGEFAFETSVTMAPELTSDGNLLVVDQTGSLLSLNSTTLQTVASRKLDSLPAKPIRIVNDVFFVEQENGSLSCVSDSQQLKELWSLPLEGNTVTGKPLIFEDHWWIPTSDSGVLQVSPNNGKLIKKHDTPGSCHGDPLLLNESPMIPLADGSLFFLSIDSETEKRP